MSHGSGVPGTACQMPNDCVSGFTLPDRLGRHIDGTCQPCATDLDCQGPGFCNASKVCNLGLATNQILTPSACTPLSPPVKGSATIGAFASGAVVAFDDPSGDPACVPTTPRARLFVPVRGDPSITWFDVVDDRTSGAADPFLLDCGQTTPGGRCDDGHRIGVDPYENFRGLTLPVSPVGLDVSSDGTYVVSAHQIAGSPAVGLSVNSWSSQCPQLSAVPAGLPQLPVLPHGRRGPRPQREDGARAGARAHRRLPGDERAHRLPAGLRRHLQRHRRGRHLPRQPRRLVEPLPPLPHAGRADRDHRERHRRRLARRGDRPGRSPGVRGQLRRARGPAGGTACQLMPDQTSCLSCCVDTPLQMYIANRSPPSLLLGRVHSQIVAGDASVGTPSGVFDFLEIYNQVPLTVGPSKVVLGHALMPDHTLKTYVFAVAFDTRSVFMYDPVAQQVVDVIFTGRGPDAIGFDACCDAAGTGCPAAFKCRSGEKAHALLYVGHFTDSYVGAVDLDIGHPETFGTMFASIGEPLPPLESK